MKKTITRNFLILAACLCALPAAAQISSNPNKFLGNITTSYNVDAGGGVPQFYKLWNQITCENESKWASVEGTRGNFNWGCDNAFNYAKNHNFPYKFHALVWGSQYPNWLNDLTPKERYAAYVNWYDHVKAKYNTLPMIDVVNEAVGTHQPGNPLIKASFGGGGKTGYDWLIKAFEMAYERWPDAILIYNDYNSIRFDIDNYITLVQTLRDAGAPIDAYGNQSHELKGISTTELNNALERQQDELKMPMFITEYDISSTDDNDQLKYYKEQIPIMWEKPYCAGVTLWGYVYGKTWTDDGKGYSGIYKDGEERLAMSWLRDYMASNPAKLARGPFPGAKKETSIYIRPAGMKVANGDVLPIKVHASLATKEIEKVDFYVGTELVKTMTAAPYIVDYTASSAGWKTTKAVVTATDGSTYERYGRFQVLSGKTKREPYNETVTQLPGTIKTTEYDKGLYGVSYSNASRSETVAMNDNQWMEYTVDVQEEGYYTLEMEVASTNANGMFHLSEYTLDNIVFYTDFTEVPKTGSTSTFTTIHCPMKEYLSAGRHVFCLNIDKGGFYVKNMTFKHTPTFSLPGTVEAEDYYLGGNGFNIISDNNGHVISNTTTGASADYSINITDPGKYSYEATVSSDSDDAKFTMDLILSDGTEKRLSTVSVPNTGSKNTYTVKAATIRNKITEPGLQRLRITVTSGSCNIDKVNFICTESTGINDIITDDATDTPAYNLLGVPVGNGYRGIVIRNGKKVFKK